MRKIDIEVYDDFVSPTYLKSENIFKLDYSNANTGYNVRISKSGASQWVSSDGVVYLIALEPDSTYEEN